METEVQALEEYMVVSLNYCSQNGGNVYRAPYYNGNPNIGPSIIGTLDQYPYDHKVTSYILSPTQLYASHLAKVWGTKTLIPKGPCRYMVYT